MATVTPAAIPICQPVSTCFLLSAEDLDGLVDVVRFGAKDRLAAGHLTHFIDRLSAHVVSGVYPDLPTPQPSDLEQEDSGFFNVTRCALIAVTPLETL